MSIKVGKVSIQQQVNKGWLCGQFFPDGDPFQTPDLEVYYKIFPKGDHSDKLHKHPVGTEMLIVIEGKARFRINDEILTLEKGDCVMIPGNTPDQLVEVLEDLTVIGARAPSVPNNKVFLE